MKMDSQENTIDGRTQKIGKERGNSYCEMKKSPDERHTYTHGSLTEIF